MDIMLTPYPELGDTAFSFWVYPKDLEVLILCLQNVRVKDMATAQTGCT
jgi:hypothetical protein